MDTTLYLYAVPCVDEANLHEDDREVPGTYECRVDGDVSQSLLACAVLDAFHASHAVKVLEDFSFIVTDEDGLEVADEGEDFDDHETGDLEDAADVCKIDDDIPEDIRRLAELNVMQDEH